jgi:hypothetical protein
LSRTENIMNEANRAALIDMGSFHRMAPRGYDGGTPPVKSSIDSQVTGFFDLSGHQKRLSGSLVNLADWSVFSRRPVSWSHSLGM